MPAKEEIERLAYFLWEQEGRPDGRDVFHYVDAERILRERSSVQPNGASPTKLLTDKARSVTAVPAQQAAPAKPQQTKPHQSNSSSGSKGANKGPRKPRSKR